MDGQISAAVQRYARATRSLESVRAQVKKNRRAQRAAYAELRAARQALALRAVEMYKHGQANTLDAVLGASSFSDLVTELSMMRRLAHCDREVVRTVVRTKRELADRAVALAADERTAKKLAKTFAIELATIRSRLEERRAMLAGVRADIGRLMDAQASASSSPHPTVEPPADGGGGDGDDGDDNGDDNGGGGSSGPWWSLIESAAASNGVSARGMYRLMMIESGGSATIVGPGGYYGLFQYAPTTWRGSWNPWRSCSITDGAAQIKATAHALRLGYGHAWWDPSYTWAFEGR